MEIIGLVGDRVRLVPSEASEHLENALRWMNDPEVTARLHVISGVTRRQEELFFERSLCGNFADRSGVAGSVAVERVRRSDANGV